MSERSPVLRLCAAIFAGLVTVATSLSPVIRLEPENREFLFERLNVVFYVRGTGPVATLTEEKLDRAASHVDLPFVVRNDGREAMEFSTHRSALQIGKTSIPNDRPAVVQLAPKETKEIYLRFGLADPPNVARHGYPRVHQEAERGGITS